MYRIRLWLVLMVSATLLLPVPAGAGWTIESRDSDGETAVEYFKADWYRRDKGDTTLIFDIEAASLYIIKPREKAYAFGRAEDLRRLKEARNEAGMERLFAEKVADLPDNEKAELRKAWLDHRRDQERKSSLASIRIEINETNIASTIAGYEAVKHQIWVDEELKEEWWISPEVTPTELIDLRLLDKIWLALEADQEGPHYDRSAQVRILWRKGYPLRRARHMGGLVLVTEVTKVEKDEPTPGLFQKPDHLKRFDFKELLELPEVSQ